MCPCLDDVICCLPSRYVLRVILGSKTPILSAFVRFALSAGLILTVLDVLVYV